MADMPKVGDRVNITLLNREVVAVSPITGTVYRGFDGAHYLLAPSNPATVEVLTPAPPKWHPGDVVTFVGAYSGATYTFMRRTSGVWRGQSTSGHWSDSSIGAIAVGKDDLFCDFKHVLRDGQPV